MLGYVFNICYGTPTLCSTTVDLRIFYVKYECFDTFLGISGVAFVRALLLAQINER